MFSINNNYWFLTILSNITVFCSEYREKKAYYVLLILAKNQPHLDMRTILPILAAVGDFGQCARA